MRTSTRRGSKSVTRRCRRSTFPAMNFRASGTTPYRLTNNRHEAVISPQALSGADFAVHARAASSGLRLSSRRLAERLGEVEVLLTQFSQVRERRGTPKQRFVAWPTE